MNTFKNQNDVTEFIKKYKKIFNLPMLMMWHADELIQQDKYDMAILMYLEIDKNKNLKYIYDDVTLWFRLGEYYINKGEIEKGKSYLIQIGDEIDNYEESFEFRELTAEWEKLKPYVIDEMKPSIVMHGDREDDDEPMTDGELLKIFLEEMASGGLHSYLCSYGDRLEETLVAAKNNGMTKTLELLGLVKTKYFNGNIPTDINTIEDILMGNDWWFEEEDEQYYENIEKELVGKIRFDE